MEHTSQITRILEAPVCSNRCIVALALALQTADSGEGVVGQTHQSRRRCERAGSGARASHGPAAAAGRAGHSITWQHNVHHYA